MAKVEIVRPEVPVEIVLTLSQDEAVYVALMLGRGVQNQVFEAIGLEPYDAGGGTVFTRLADALGKEGIRYDRTIPMGQALRVFST